MRNIILAIFILSFALLYRTIANEQLAFYYLVFLITGTMFVEGHWQNLNRKLFESKNRIAVFGLAVITLLFNLNLSPPFTLGLIIFLFLVLFKIETDTAIQYAAYIFISIPIAFLMKALPTAEFLTTCLFFLLMNVTILYIINQILNYARPSTQSSL